MALPQIQEMDPWLEEDEEVFMNSGIHCKKQFFLPARKQTQCLSFTGLVTNLAKISFYAYLLCKLLSKSTVAQRILKHLASNSTSLGSLSTALMVFVLFLLKRLKKASFN